MSQIVDFYANKVVFLTGCTGFLGKLLLEKLLRVCAVKRVYVLVRQKKGKCEADRYAELFDLPMFEPLKRQLPDYQNRITMVAGDCSAADLGIAADNWEIIQEATNIVIHCAATVRFDQALRTAYNINVRATRDLVLRAKKMPHLQSFIHVSTAYSNCPRTDIDERVYQPPMTDTQLDTFLKVFDDEDAQIARLTPNLLGDWPNTYSFTKCVGEEMVQRLAMEMSLPVAIVRPSIIVSTFKEPIPGWIDNIYGVIGVSYGVGLGLLRTLHCCPKNRADLVPADYVVNAILAASWATTHREHEQQVEVYNFTSGEYSTNWEKYMADCQKYTMKLTSTKTLWRITLTLNQYKFVHHMYLFFLHTIPAHFVDLLARIIGREPLMVEGYKKLHKFMDAITYFTLRQWNFGNAKFDALYEKKFNEEDRKLFEVRIKTFEWEPFMEDYLRGGRLYLLHEPMSTLPEARRRYRRLVIAHWGIVGCLAVLGLYLLYVFYQMLF